MEDIKNSPLYNKDLAPVPENKRTWSRWHIAALWVGMAVCIPTYMLASSLVQQGLDWKWSLFVVFISNLIILIPMTLNAHPGTKYGIPFPVLLRASFGIYGANVVALLRGAVACGWFGIQTWVGGFALYIMIIKVLGINISNINDIPILGINFIELLCFLTFWGINMFVIAKGMNCIKWLETLAAPVLILVGIGLLIWAFVAVGDTSKLFASNVNMTNQEGFWTLLFAGITANVGFWSTLSLNIPDFSRYAKSQKDQIIGQVMGLPPTMAFYAGVGVIVTSATIIVFGTAIPEPMALLNKLESRVITPLAVLVMLIATLSTNIAANIVSPANDISNLNPQKINFKMGGIIAGIIGIFIMPWKLYEDPNRYISTWLIGYSALLGPVAGIMISDYFLWRKKKLDVKELYNTSGIYKYNGGFCIEGFTALVIGVLPNIPGFLSQIGWVEKNSVPNFFHEIYSLAWFVGFTLSLLVYYLLKKILRGNTEENLIT